MKRCPFGPCDLGQSDWHSWDISGAGGAWGASSHGKPRPTLAMSPRGGVLGAEGPRSWLVPGSRPPSVEDVLQDGGCGESRSLTQSETDPPVDVFLPGNGGATGAGAATGAPGPGGSVELSLRWD